MIEHEFSRYEPAMLQRMLHATLPRSPHVVVTPRDINGRKCAAWRAYWYEIQAYYTSMGASLDELQTSMADLPGVTRTTRKRDAERLEDPTWPSRRKDVASLRPQVLALMEMKRI